MGQPTTPVLEDHLPPGMPLVIRDLDQIATQAARNPNDTGYTLGVVTREGLAWTKSYGYADAGRLFSRRRIGIRVVRQLHRDRRFDSGVWLEPRRHAGVILLHQGFSGAALGQMIHTYVPLAIGR